MTREERYIKLNNLITCMKCEVSGRVCDENCPTQYEAGNMEEIIENLDAISEILDKEPCDAISRSSANKRIKDICSKYGLSYEDGERKPSTGGSAYALGHVFDDLPSVTPIRKDRTVTEFADKCRECGKHTNKWIPCSERLPEEDGDYLLWGKIDEDEDEYTFIGSYDSGCEEFGIWQEQFDRTTLGCLGSDFFEYASVIAWMPLPKPYKAEMESEE